MPENGSTTGELLRADEVAQVLKISKSQTHRLIRAGQLPAVCFGRCVRIRAADLDAFIIAHTRMAPVESQEIFHKTGDKIEKAIIV